MSNSSDALQSRFLEKFLIKNNIKKSKIENILDNTFSLNGVMAVSLIDLKSGTILGSMSNNNLNVDLASILNNGITEKVIQMAKDIDSPTQNSIQSIVITYQEQIHITYNVQVIQERELYLYLIANAKKTNLVLINNMIESIIK